MFEFFGWNRSKEQRNKLEEQQKELTQLTIQVEKSLVEFKLEIRNLRSSLDSNRQITEKELNRMSSTVEKIEDKFSKFSHTIMKEHRRFGESDVRHTEQIIWLFKIAERAQLVNDEERKQLNLYVQTNSGTGQQIGENEGEVNG